MRHLPPLLPLLLACTLANGCVGDIGSSDESSPSSTTTTNTEQNGISECSIRCEPAEGGWLITQECSGRIQDGPEFREVAPLECAFPPEEEPTEEPAA